MNVSTMLKLGGLAAGGIAVGATVAALVDDNRDKDVAAHDAKVARAREQLDTPGLSPEAREGLQRVVDSKRPPTTSGVTNIMGATTAGVGAATWLGMGALGITASLFGMFVDGGRFGERIMNIGHAAGVAGAVIGAGIIAGGAIEQLVDRDG